MNGFTTLNRLLGKKNKDGKYTFYIKPQIFFYLHSIKLQVYQNQNQT